MLEVDTDLTVLQRRINEEYDRTLEYQQEHLDRVGKANAENNRAETLADLRAKIMTSKELCRDIKSLVSSDVDPQICSKLIAKELHTEYPLLQQATFLAFDNAGRCIGGVDGPICMETVKTRAHLDLEKQLPTENAGPSPSSEVVISEPPSTKAVEHQPGGNGSPSKAGSHLPSANQPLIPGKTGQHRVGMPSTNMNKVAVKASAISPMSEAKALHGSRSSEPEMSASSQATDRLGRISDAVEPPSFSLNSIDAKRSAEELILPSSCEATDKGDNPHSLDQRMQRYKDCMSPVMLNPIGNEIEFPDMNLLSLSSMGLGNESTNAWNYLQTRIASISQQAASNGTLTARYLADHEDLPIPTMGQPLGTSIPPLSQLIEKSPLSQTKLLDATDWNQRSGLKSRFIIGRENRNGICTTGELAYHMSEVDPTQKLDIVNSLLACRRLEKTLEDQHTLIDKLQSSLEIMRSKAINVPDNLTADQFINLLDLDGPVPNDYFQLPDCTAKFYSRLHSDQASLLARSTARDAEKRLKDALDKSFSRDIHRPTIIARTIVNNRGQAEVAYADMYKSRPAEDTSYGVEQNKPASKQPAPSSKVPPAEAPTAGLTGPAITQKLIAGAKSATAKSTDPSTAGAVPPAQGVTKAPPAKPVAKGTKVPAPEGKSELSTDRPGKPVADASPTASKDGSPVPAKEVSPTKSEPGKTSVAVKVSAPKAATPSEPPAAKTALPPKTTVPAKPGVTPLTKDSSGDATKAQVPTKPVPPKTQTPVKPAAAKTPVPPTTAIPSKADLTPKTAIPPKPDVPTKADLVSKTAGAPTTVVPAKTDVAPKAAIPPKTDVPSKTDLTSKTGEPSKNALPPKASLPPKTAVPAKTVIPAKTALSPKTAAPPKTVVPAQPNLPPKSDTSKTASPSQPQTGTNLRPPVPEVPAKDVPRGPEETKTSSPAKVPLLKETSQPQKTASPVKPTMPNKTAPPQTKIPANVGETNGPSASKPAVPDKTTLPAKPAVPNKTPLPTKAVPPQTSMKLNPGEAKAGTVATPGPTKTSPNGVTPKAPSEVNQLTTAQDAHETVNAKPAPPNSPSKSGPPPKTPMTKVPLATLPPSGLKGAKNLLLKEKSPNKSTKAVPAPKILTKKGISVAPVGKKSVSPPRIQ